MKVKDYIVIALLCISILFSCIALGRAHVIQGEQGIQGETGAQGPQGERGETGLTGAKGEQGLQGIQGIQGVQGERGLTGAQGAKGDTGAQGIQGAKGDKGDKGDTGAQGIQGAKGDKGDKGDTGSNGLTPYIGSNGNWWIGTTDTQVLAEGQVYITSNYYQWLTTTKTMHMADFITIENGGGSPSHYGWNFLYILSNEWKDYITLSGSLNTYQGLYQGKIEFNQNTVKNIQEIVFKYTSIPSHYSATNLSFYTDGTYVYERIPIEDYIWLSQCTTNNYSSRIVSDIIITADFYTLID